VAWRIDPGCVQVSVSDGGGATMPELGQPTPGRPGGGDCGSWRSCPPAGGRAAARTAPRYGLRCRP
jgi:hypothetical protein